MTSWLLNFYKAKNGDRSRSVGLRIPFLRNPPIVEIRWWR